LPKIPEKVDFMIIGSGIAGLSFALRMAPFGTVAIVTKKRESESNTNYAQGGIASVMDSVDSFSKHIDDTLEAGAGLCDPKTVERVVQSGPDAITRLVELGVKFSYKSAKKDLKELALGREGGHSEKRVVHAADYTGREIETRLIRAIKANKNVTVLENHIAIDLITMNNHGKKQCFGAWIFDVRGIGIVKMLAGTILLATGGLGQVYLHTTNPRIATGDGVAMAYRAGAEVSNLEFMQFHPTSLFHPEGEGFLISEAARGEGGKLRLRNGKRFMQKYNQRAELATRDIVARAIDRETKLSGDPCVFLDLTHLKSKYIRQRFPNIYKKLKNLGIDITMEWIPVVPAAHYMCGGVITDSEGRTSIENLYAVGEVGQTGMHGGNRLASNSLLEAVVFAEFAAKSAQKRPTKVDIDESGLSSEFDRVTEGKISISEEEKILISHATLDIKQIMSNYVGVVRSIKRLLWAKRRLATIHDDIDDLWQNFPLSYDLIELRNLGICAELIVNCAQARLESRGLHYNIDYPHTDDEHWKKDTIINKKTNNG
jgi:L-aspartate oxidase